MTSLDQLISGRADLWRGRSPSPSAGDGIPSGFADLDTLLSDGGWPRGALVEILAGGPGRGGLELILPALARLSRDSRWVALVAPPLDPYAPGWAGAGLDLSRLLLIHAPDGREGLWALEQALRSGACSAVLGWPGRMEMRSLRRLQLAAEAGQATGFLFRPEAAQVEPSPAPLRLRVAARPGGLEVRILKCRGAWSPGPLLLDSPKVSSVLRQALAGVAPAQAARP